MTKIPKKKRPNPWHDKRNDIIKKTIRNKKEGCDVYIWVTNELSTVVIDAGSRDEEGDRDEMRWASNESPYSKKMHQLSFWLNMPIEELIIEMKSVKDEMKKVLKEREDRGKEKDIVNKRVKDLVQGEGYCFDLSD